MCPVRTFGIKKEVREWLESEKIIHKSQGTDYVLGIIHFFRKEDAAIYILMFNGKKFENIDSYFSEKYSENRML